MDTTTSKAAQTNKTVEVDFLYLDLTTCSRCVGSDEALDAAVEAVRPALDSMGADVEVRKTLVETEEQAHRLGFVSSPTILVNGRDVAGELIESSCRECGELCGCGGGVDCRVWDYRGEIHTEAPAGLIVEAILSEAFGQPAGARGEGSPEATTPSADAPENLRRFFAGSGTSAAGEASSCCSTEEQATCCEPAEKAGCCGEVAGPSSCGCR